MRLLHSLPGGVIKAEEFYGDNIPAYAILSHTWEDGEVTFQDLQGSSYHKKLGWRKIKYTCRQAYRDGLDYCWVDTCCIDKSSSAELSEAINSMWNWYREAKICYAYLGDINISDPSAMDEDELREQLAQARWFSRGWTLQELIAPKLVQFYTAGWKPLKTKTEICAMLSQISGIGEGALSGKTPLQEFSVAQRMSWAAKRTTTRIEDEAYCLLGLFDVQLPLLYGEGKKAFLRLQEEIIRTNDDQSIFAWENEGYFPNFESRLTGLLAHFARQFKDAGNIYSPCSSTIPSPCTISSKRLRIELPVKDDLGPTRTAVLNCARHGKSNGAVTIQLEQVDEVQFQRISTYTGVTDIQNLEQWKPQAIFVPISVSTFMARDFSLTSIELNLPYQDYSRADFRLAAVHPRQWWDGSVLRTVLGSPAAFMFERIQYHRSDIDSFVIIVVVKSADHPRIPRLLWSVAITERRGKSTLEEFVEVSRAF
jgi:hypothetical protein